MSSQLASSLAEQGKQVLMTSMEQLRICNYITVSALAWMIYDIVINLGREIPLVYGKNTRSTGPCQHFLSVQRGCVSLLYIFSRYYGLFFLATTFIVNNTTGLSVTFCKRYYYCLILAGTLIYVTIVNIILSLRINALYTGSRYCKTFLIFIVTGEFLVEVAICAIMAMHDAAVIVAPPSIHWRGCMLSSHATPTLALASWLVALLTSTIFCVMTLRNIIRSLNFGTRDVTVSLNERMKTTPILRVLLQDGVTLYILSFVMVLVSTVVLAVVQNTLAAIVVPLLVATYSYCTSRLILNIRAVEDELCPVDVPEDSDSLPSVRFARPEHHELQPVASSSTTFNA